MISPWTGQAFNQAPNADNQIHGDDLAQQYGFTGGLVPGVTISAYLIQPAVDAWGLDWLTRGAAHVRVSSPLYDEEKFEVSITESTDSSYNAELVRTGGVVSATAEVFLPDTLDTIPVRRHDPISDPEYIGPTATPVRWAKLKNIGCQAFRYPWPGESAMRTYLRDESGMPELLRHDGGGYANMGFILVCSNWILESNAQMNPWVHLETRSRNYRPIPAGTSIVTEMSVVDFFEKKGHEFVDVDVALFDEQDDACLTTIQLRAIYKLRGTK